MDVQLVLFVSWFSLLTYFMQLVFFYTPTTRVPQYQYQSSGYPEFFLGSTKFRGGLSALMVKMVKISMKCTLVNLKVIVVLKGLKPI